MIHSEEKLKDDAEFEVKGELPKPQEASEENGEGSSANNGAKAEPTTSTSNGASDTTVINADDDGTLNKLLV